MFNLKSSIISFLTVQQWPDKYFVVFEDDDAVVFIRHLVNDKLKIKSMKTKKSNISYVVV